MTESKMTFGKRNNILRILGMTCLVLCVFCLLARPAQAAGAYVDDQAGLMTAEEQSALEETLEETSASLNMDIVVVTTNSTDGQSANGYANDYYDNNGYRSDGVLLLVDMGERVWAISTTGDAIEAFDEDQQEEVMDTVASMLSDADYYDAFVRFASLTQTSIASDSSSSGFSLDGLAKPIAVVAVIAFLVALIRVMVMRSKLKSVRPEDSAQEYLTANGVHLTNRRDTFLYHQVTKVRKSSDSGGGGGHGGGGGGHGGSHGHF